MTPASAARMPEAFLKVNGKTLTSLVENGNIYSLIGKALMRNSTFLPDYRKLSGDARQWKERMELTLEQLPEIKGE